MIKANVDEEQGDWDLHLNKFAYAYNSAIQESTKQTPFEMMFGRKPKIPMDIVLPNHNGVDNQVNERQPEQDNENLGEKKKRSSSDEVKRSRKQLFSSGLQGVWGVPGKK